MSMTESGVKLQPTIENGLSPEMQARFARIQALAKQNRRQYAVQQSEKRKAEGENPKADARKAVMAAPRRKSRKAAKPYFYNPAHRD